VVVSVVTKKRSYKYVSNCELLNLLHFFVGFDDRRSSPKKSGYKRRIAHSHFGHCFSHKERLRSTQGKTNAIFANKLQSALKLTVGLSKFHCKLQQISHFCSKNLPFKHQIIINMKLTVSNFSLFFYRSRYFFICTFKQILLWIR
jgi:hypothetical protein